MSFAQRVAPLAPEGAYVVLARAQQLEAEGREVIHLEIGEPDFTTPSHVADAGVQAIRAGQTRYNPTPGIPALREAIAADARARRGVDASPEQVVVGPGAKPALFFPTLALIEPGDEVVYPDPGFPTYEAMIRVAGGTPKPVALSEESDFSFDLAAFDAALSERTKLIVLNSPSNPTGGIIPREDLEHIARAAIERDAWVLSDEIYSRMVYDGAEAPSIAAVEGMSERTVICDGFSKTWSMTGWRLGYGIMPANLARKVSLLMVHAVGCTAQFTQYAGIEAITGPQDQAEAMLAEYARRRDALVSGLNDLPGVTCRTPGGAFYAFPNVRGIGRPCDQIASMLLEEAGVACLPGTSFGQAGEGYLRLCYANSLDHIHRALDRMREALGRL